MISPLRLIGAALLVAVGLGARQSAAGVVLLDNRTARDVQFTIRQTDAREWRYTLEHGDIVPVPAAGPLAITFQSDGQTCAVPLAVNTIYLFLGRDKHLELAQLQAPAVGGPPAAVRPPARAAAPVAAVDPVVSIPVMILADNREPMAREPWEKKIRNRLAEASKVFEQHCRIRFEPVSVGAWETDPKVFLFDKSFAVFRARAPLRAPARLAIGFTSQYAWVPGEHRVGEASGPLFSHILIRDALHGFSEPERLEILIHELGHYLGAVHVPQNTSVMRPIIGDQQSRLKSFRIRFDGPNTLAMYLVAEEMRIHPIMTLAQLAPERKAVLRGVYAAITQAMPKDQTAREYTSILNSWAPPAPPGWPPRPAGAHASMSPTADRGLAPPGAKL